MHDTYAERETVRREIDRLRSVEGEHRARVRSLVDVTLQAVRDHEEWLASRESGAPEAA